MSEPKSTDSKPNAPAITKLLISSRCFKCCNMFLWFCYQISGMAQQSFKRHLKAWLQIAMTNSYLSRANHRIVLKMISYCCEINGHKNSHRSICVACLGCIGNAFW